MKEILLKAIYNYLPANVAYTDPRYGSTPEITKLAALCRTLQQRPTAWDALISALQVQFNGNVQDWTMLQTLDRSFRFSIGIETTGEHYTMLVVHISFIAPYYGMYMLRRSKTTVPIELEWTGDAVAFSDKNKSVDFDLNNADTSTLAIIDELVCRHFPCSLLPADISRQIVPDLSLHGKNFGEATIFMAVFTENIL